MKTVILNLCFGACMILITGCPVGSNYPLGYPGTEKMDERLLGVWENNESDPEVKKIIISLADEFSYDVQIVEKGSMYEPAGNKLKGWVTPLNGLNFVYFKPVDEFKYYLYCYEIVNEEKIFTYNVGLKSGGKDAVTSTESYRAEVVASLSHPDCIGEKIEWYRK
jgi:hypothetical protein